MGAVLKIYFTIDVWLLYVIFPSFSSWTLCPSPEACVSILHQKLQHHIFNHHSNSTWSKYFFPKQRKTVYSFLNLTPSSLSEAFKSERRQPCRVSEVNKPFLFSQYLTKRIDFALYLSVTDFNVDFNGSILFLKNFWILGSLNSESLNFGPQCLAHARLHIPRNGAKWTQTIWGVFFSSSVI